MKQNKTISIIFFFLIAFTIKAQTIAYDAAYSYYNHTDCIDLSWLNATVKGHQNNVLVEYFATLNDAQNQLNKLPVYYSYASNIETLYARVTNTNTLDFATSEISIVLSDIPSGGPPPPGQYEYEFCDVDNDGVEVAHLRGLSKADGLIYNTMFCDLYDNQISYSYHLTNQDAIDETDAINEVYTFTGDTYIYCKIKNSVNSNTFILDFILRFTTCTATDDDADGIDNVREDANRNGNINDDDTDSDGLKNFEDEDDDGDGILTINEDYNNSGSAFDDDTNFNGIPDYLEYNVTLSNPLFIDSKIGIYPNPVIDFLNIESNNMEEFSVKILDLNGRKVLDFKSFTDEKSINVTKLHSGIYFLKLNSNTINVTKKFIKK